jgi:hypothetical protein
MGDPYDDPFGPLAPVESGDQDIGRLPCFIGICYKRGLGVAVDQVEAVKWFRKAAEQDNALAQSILGGCCGGQTIVWIFP